MIARRVLTFFLLVAMVTVMASLVFPALQLPLGGCEPLWIAVLCFIILLINC